MKKLEILRELPKCDTEIQTEQMLLEKQHQQTCFMQGCQKPSICKKLQYLQSAIKQSTIKQDMPINFPLSIVSVKCVRYAVLNANSCEKI